MRSPWTLCWFRRYVHCSCHPSFTDPHYVVLLGIPTLKHFISCSLKCVTWNSSWFVRIVSYAGDPATTSSWWSIPHAVQDLLKVLKQAVMFWPWRPCSTATPSHSCGQLRYSIASLSYVGISPTTRQDTEISMLLTTSIKITTLWHRMSYYWETHHGCI